MPDKRKTARLSGFSLYGPGPDSQELPINCVSQCDSPGRLSALILLRMVLSLPDLSQDWFRIN